MRGSRRIPLLDNIAWHTLTGLHAAYATGTSDARRYAPGFSPIVGFRDTERPNFEALAPYCEADEHFYCDGWAGTAPAGWRIDFESTMYKMVWESSMPAIDELPEAVALRSGTHVPSTRVGQPDPPGTVRSEDDRTWRLLWLFSTDGAWWLWLASACAPAGSERSAAYALTRNFKGAGLARRLVAKLVRREMQRAETPFLHVVRDNSIAHRHLRANGVS